MIKLYGLRMSNYYSLTKALLIEKGLDFEEVNAPPTQESDNLARTPMGKMPSIEVNGRFMSESLAIFNYLERLQPEPALLPKDPFASGKTLELACHIKLDVELVARRFLPEVLFKKPVSDETKKKSPRISKRAWQPSNESPFTSPISRAMNSRSRIFTRSIASDLPAKWRRQ
jgi:glutathione S-transferase